MNGINNMIDLHNTTIPEIFRAQVKKYDDAPCVAYKDLTQGRYIDISWKSMDTMVKNLANFLLSQGVKKGDRVALFSPNRPEWWVADLAILSVGGVNVPIYATNSAEETRYILKNSGSKICICGSAEHMEKTLEAQKTLTDTGTVIVFDNIETKKRNVITLAKAMEKGEKYQNKRELDKRIKSLKPEEMATIIYTSGTTGDPKGVMLSHSNFVANCRQIINDLDKYIVEGHVLLSFLPLSHSLERTAGYYIPMSIGAKVAFAEEFSKVIENMNEVKPTFIISVPRLYEKIHSTIMSRLPEASAVKRFLFKMAVNTASKNLPYVCNDKKPGGLLGLRIKLFDKLVFSKLKAGLGMERMDFAVSGGAPLSVSDAEFFIGMGIKIIEGFGLTETTPITNANLPWKIKPGTVGPPVSETQVKISDEGELLIKGPQVMMGYYKNKKATDKVFTKDGWFKTGDMARIDEEGFVAITGRIKDIIVTAGGKNISPQNIENSLKGSEFIEQVAIIGDRRKYLSALIIPSFETLEKWAQRNNIEYENLNELLCDEKVNTHFRSEVDQYTKKFARVEQIRKFTLLDAEWTQETEELTPSLKIKRRVVEEKYKDEIDAMYPPG